MLYLILYASLGIVLHAAYETWSPETKFVYGFLFPAHWVVIHWLMAVWKNGTFWNNWPLWIPIGVLFCLLCIFGLV